jgi:hypothetical protein
MREFEQTIMTVVKLALDKVIRREFRLPTLDAHHVVGRYSVYAHPHPSLSPGERAKPSAGHEPAIVPVYFLCR